MVYPNQINVPLMENSGLPKPPVGMLEINVIRASGLRTGDTFSKGDPYVRISVQERKLPDDEEVEEDGDADGAGVGKASKATVEDEVIVLKEHPSHQTAHHKNTKTPEFNEHFKVRCAASVVAAFVVIPARCVVARMHGARCLRIGRCEHAASRGDEG